MKAVSEPGVTITTEVKTSLQGWPPRWLFTCGIQEGLNWELAYLFSTLFLQILFRESSGTPVINFPGPRETHSPSAHSHLCGVVVGVQEQPARFRAMETKAECVHLQAQDRLSSLPGTIPHPAAESGCSGQDKWCSVICLGLKEEKVTSIFV